jgi:very-short-patch-repair endonuclease
MKKSKTDDFIAKSNGIHGERYEYTKTEYVNAKTKVTIICKQHGEFQQTPSNHLSGYNCQKCAKNLKMDTNTYVERAKQIHSNKYDYSKVNYVNADTKVTIICKEHGEFEQIPDFHLNRKTGCPKCANNVTHEVNDFIENAQKSHGNKYDYSQVNYINNYTFINIICKEHGLFKQKPYSHVRGVGCPHCINKTEHKLWSLLKEIYPTVKRQFKVEWCKNKRCLPYDFAIEEYKIIIELDGEQHFKQIANWKSPELQLEIDKYKINCANNNGYSVVRVLQKEVSSEDWSFNTLRSCIDELIACENVRNAFFCDNDEYKLHN